MNQPRIIPFSAVDPAHAEAIGRLHHLVWPALGDWHASKNVSGLSHMEGLTGFHVVIGEGEQLALAQAQIFRRDIFASCGLMPVGALARVCVHPEFRGRGWGASVVKAAFELLPALGATVCLFQTPVCQFYETLGCRLVSNHFYDGTRCDGALSNPFWDTCTMIYPVDSDWPEGPIDLGGPGY